MVKYLSREDTLEALRKMKAFHDDLEGVMEKNGFDLLENLGRRNILLSQAQEKYFAEVLSSKYKVVSDGRTGEPDIFIESLDRELECKLTSRHKSGTISFQTDYETLVKKQKLDYLYVVANDLFDEFAVVFYEDLTVDDFRKLSSGARGKTQMMKHASHDRAQVLVGDMVNINDIELSKLKKKLEKANTDSQKKKIKNSINYWKSTPTKFKIVTEHLNA